MPDRAHVTADRIGSKGSIIRLFGVIILFVGVLDSMLFWKGGMVGHGFYFFLIAIGLFLYAVGSVSRRH
jgi:hypothetical protein